MPAAVPTMSPNAVAHTAMISSTQPPSSTRDSTSRPSVSPPSRNWAEGRPKFVVTSASAPCGVTNGPMTAVSTTNRVSPSPIAPRGVRTAASSVEAQARRRRAGTGGAAAVVLACMVTSRSGGAGWPLAR